MKVKLLLLTTLMAGLLAGCTAPVNYMPSLLGNSQSEAKSTLAELGIDANFESEFSDSVPRDKVISTSPGPGEELSGNQQLIVTISKGPEPEPEPVAWAPKKFTEMDENVAFRWTKPSGDPCGYSPCLFWRAEVITKNGCPSGVYAEMNVLQGSSVVDWTNDTISALKPGQVGKLVFTVYGWGNSPGSFSGELTELSCR